MFCVHNELVLILPLTSISGIYSLFIRTGLLCVLFLSFCLCKETRTIRYFNPLWFSLRTKLNAEIVYPTVRPSGFGTIQSLNEKMNLKIAFQNRYSPLTLGRWNNLSICIHGTKPGELLLFQIIIQ